MHVEDRIAHGDIKPDNVMFRDDLGLTFIDFGHSEPSLTSLRSSNIGTVGYRAPEIGLAMYGNAYVIDPTDVYSLACTLFTVLFQDSTFGRFNQAFFNANYHLEETRYLFFGAYYRNFLPGDERHPFSILELIYACLNPDPCQRPTIQEVLQHEWIQGAPVTLGAGDCPIRGEIQEIFSMNPHPKMGGHH